MSALAAIQGSRATRVVLIAVALLIAVLAARAIVYEIEDVMRGDPLLQPPAWQIQRQATQMKETVVADDYLGFRLAPDREELVETLDFTFRRTAGTEGFPVAGPWPDKADVVFLGDSLILGEGVGTDRSFVSRIDQAWPDRIVINLGSHGAGAARQARIFERYGRRLQPLLVVACLYLASDLENDTHFSAWLEDPLGMEYNEFRLSYRRRMDRRPKNHIGKRLELHPVYGWTQSFLEPLLWGQYRIPHRTDFADGSRVFLDREKVKFARAGYAGDEADFSRLLAALARLKALTEGYQSTLAIMLIPSKEEIYGVKPGEDVVNAAGRLKHTLDEQGIFYLDLEPALRQRGLDRPAFFRRDIHLNDLGNEIAARAFMEWTSAQIDLPKRGELL